MLGRLPPTGRDPRLGRGYANLQDALRPDWRSRPALTRMEQQMLMLDGAAPPPGFEGPPVIPPGPPPAPPAPPVVPTVTFDLLLDADRDGTLDVRAGQAVLARRGEWVRYSTPEPEGAESARP